jgi:DNA-binding response OmpR family regulator
MRTVLLVEGSKTFRGAIADVLTRHHFKVLQAESGFDALQVLESYPYTVALCVLNTELAGEDVIGLARRMRAERDGLKVIFFGRNLLDPSEAFISEPLRPQDIVDTASALLERRVAERRGPPIPGGGLIRERRKVERRAHPAGAAVPQSEIVQRGPFPTR